MRLVRLLLGVVAATLTGSMCRRNLLADGLAQTGQFCRIEGATLEWDARKDLLGVCGGS